MADEKDSKSLINVSIGGDLSKPATVLVERISDAVGGLCRPRQIRRVAQAESDAEIIRASTEIEVTELQRRAMRRFVAEETRKQINIESIAAKAIPLLTDDAIPEAIDVDWLASFLDKCRFTSDEHVQKLWARILAGEGNSPGKFSRTTTNTLAILDKADALGFQDLCSFVWTIHDMVEVIVYDVNAPVYKGQHVDFNLLLRLSEVGLVTLGQYGRFSIDDLPSEFKMMYFDKCIAVELPEKRPEQRPFRFDIGKVKLTRAGSELATICDAEPVPEFADYIITGLRKENAAIHAE